MTVLVWSPEKKFAFEAIAIAKSLGGTVAAAVLGEKVDNTEEYAHRGADIVTVVEDPALKNLRPEQVAVALEACAKEAGATRIFISATRRGKEIAPRLAARMDAACITAASSVKEEGGKLQFERTALGGKTIATEVAETDAVVATFAPRLFEPAEPDNSKQADVKMVSVQLPETAATVVEVKEREDTGVNLEEANVVVAIGRGVKEKDDMQLAFDLAKELGGQVGCSRPIATDLGWLTDDYWIGLSGKEVAPSIYIALGISGQIQHTTGIRGSKTIISVNTNKDAPIFKVSDYGVVADLYKVVPPLIEEVKKRK